MGKRMKTEIEIPVTRKQLTILDDLEYSSYTDADGNEKTLKLTLMLSKGNAEQKLIQTGYQDQEDENASRPLLLCFCGGGYTHCERTRILPELYFLAEAGFIIASIDYRLSNEAAFPAQMEDAYAALNYLLDRKDLKIDRNNIGTFGRSAGGHLALMLAMNQTNQISDWDLPKIQAACSMYGIGDIQVTSDYEMQSHYFSKAETYSQTLFGRLLHSRDDEEFLNKAKAASPSECLSSQMASLLLMHGDNDPIIPWNSSATLYEKARELGLEDKISFYTLKGAGHGSAEFFQPPTQKIVLDFFTQKLNQRSKSK